MLLGALRALASARDLDALMTIVRRAARELTRADGVTFTLVVPKRLPADA